jgi:hypothetical protein
MNCCTASAAADEVAKKRIAVEKRLWETAKTALKELREERPAKAFTVVVDDRKMEWKQPAITRATLFALFGLPEDARLEVVERDGQTRPLKDKAEIDLTRGVVFRSIP